MADLDALAGLKRFLQAGARCVCAEVMFREFKDHEYWPSLASGLKAHARRF